MLRWTILGTVLLAASAAMAHGQTPGDPPTPRESSPSEQGAAEGDAGASEFTGVSDRLDFQEALRDALHQVPVSGDRQFRFQVVRTSGVFGGIAPVQRLLVTIRTSLLGPGGTFGGLQSEWRVDSEKHPRPGNLYITLINDTDDIGTATILLASDQKCEHFPVRRGKPSTVWIDRATGFGAIAFSPRGRSIGSANFQLLLPYELTLSGNATAGYRLTPNPLE